MVFFPERHRQEEASEFGPQRSLRCFCCHVLSKKINQFPKLTYPIFKIEALLLLKIILVLIKI